MRLGELLIADGRLSEEQVEQGLRAQVLWGGRLGSNLVELGLLDLDELSWMLARLHGMPVALARHFTQPDAALQQRLGSALAERWQCVPLARLADDPPRIGLATTTPLPDEAVAEIAAALGEVPDAIVVAIAAEMRIFYHLELSYGLDRPARYLRTRDDEVPEAPPPVLGEGSESELELPQPAAPAATGAAIAEPPPLTLATDGDEVPTGPQHRRYMPMVGDEEQQIARIAIRRVQVYASEEGGGEAEPWPESWPEALRAIRRAHDRDRVGQLAVTSLTAFCTPLRVAALLVVRGHVAIGWQGWHRDGPLDVRSLAVPLDQPSAIADAVTSGQVVHRSARQASELDRRLAAALAVYEQAVAARSPSTGTADGEGAPAAAGSGRAAGGEPGGEAATRAISDGGSHPKGEEAAAARVLISPISLSKGRVACVLYCQLDGGEEGAGERGRGGGGDEAPEAEVVENVVASMRSAFLRLIRAASR